MDVQALYQANAAAANSKLNFTKFAVDEDGNLFSNLLGAAVESLGQTNGYLSDAENAEIQFALGETENAHDLTIALNKAETALQYTVAIRDKFMDAYKEIMQIQI
ncbi:MAG: flagellar hook-basal body complex protein FliE [Lachnospiraceae bacterium]|nr:flagellar hook-basal body complex protein FliE [Candidatus Merdinaster equi]